MVKKTLAKVLAVVALVACCAGFLLLQGDYLELNDVANYALQGPGYAQVDAEGNLYVVDAARSRLLRVNTARELEQTWDADGVVFSELDDIQIDPAGNVYALDIVRAGGGRQIEEERVLLVGDDGTTEVLYSDVHTVDFVNRRIPQLLVWDGAPAFVLLEDDGFVLKVRQDGGWAETTYPFEDARRTLFRFCPDGAGGIVCLTRQGRIYAADTAGQHTLLYDAADHAGDMPWSMASDAAGTVYVADIGNRTLNTLENGALVPFYSDSEDKFESTIYYQVSAEYGLVANSGYLVVAFEDGQPVYYESFPVSGGILALRVLTLVLGALSILGIAVALVLLVRYIIKKRSFVVTFSAGVMAGTMLLTGLFCLIAFGNINARITDEMMSRLLNVAQLTARIVPTDSFEQLDGVSDYMSEDYLAVSTPIEEQFLSEDSAQNDLYCVLYRIIDGSIAEVFSLDGSGTVNYPYDAPYEGSDEQEILTTGQYKTYVSPLHMDGAFIFALCPVKDASGTPVGLIEVGTDLTGFREDTINLLVELFLNIASIAVAIIMLLLELIVFVNVLRQRQAAPKLAAKTMPIPLTRSAIFLVFFATNLSTSYFPLYVQDLAQQAGRPLGMSVEFLTALPVSADVLFGSVAALFGNRTARKLGTRQLALWGAAFFAAGMLLKYLAPYYLLVLLGSILSGLGWGSLLYLVNLRIGTDTDSDARTKGFSGSTVAMMSGVNCGVVFGAFLLNWLDYRGVLGVSAVVAGVTLLYAIAFMRGIHLPAREQQRKATAKSRVSFMFSIRVLPFFLCLLVPMIAGASYLNYFFPIVGHNLGLSDSNVGYAFLLNSLAVILFGPALVRVLGKSIGRRFSLLVWGALYILAFVLFAQWQTVGVLLFTLVILGLADGFGLPMYSSYYTSLPEVAEFGTGRALGLLTTVENAAQALGPFLFSYILYLGVGPGLRLAGGVIGALVLIFLVTSFMGGRKARKAAAVQGDGANG